MMKPIAKNNPVLSKDIHWKATPGAGDIMMGLNSAHRVAHILQEPVSLTFHYFHDGMSLHHPEDAETIIERGQYIHNFYRDQHMVDVSIKLNSDDEDIDKYRARGAYRSTGNPLSSSWFFRDDCQLPIDEHKVVFWRPTFNAEVPRDWKLLLSHYDYDKILSMLSYQGLDHAVELTYKTPISEAMYHINTAKLVLCYDGMWHYIAKNFYKPMIVISRSAVTKFNTPHCIMLSEKDIFHYMRNWDKVKSREILFDKLKEELRTFKVKAGVKYRCNALEQIERRARWYKAKILELT
jgi:hypothetical protein